MLQGYYLSMPVPADQFARYLAVAAKHDPERSGVRLELRSEASKR
jgi:hypothetical protein